MLLVAMLAHLVMVFSHMLTGGYTLQWLCSNTAGDHVPEVPEFDVVPEITNQCSQHHT